LDAQASATAFPSFNWLRGVADDKRIPIIHRLALLRFGLQPPTSRAPDIIATELGVEPCTVLGAIDAAVRRGYLFRARPGEFVTICGRPPPITKRPNGASRRAEPYAPAQAPSKDKRAAARPGKGNAPARP
jgi:hypothetical protein